MVTMYVLRMLADVSFFGAFAGLIAAKCGGGGAFAGMLIQCLCFGLSALGGSKRLLRLVLLLPMGLGWIIAWGSVADCILLIPTAAYIIWLVWKGDYALDRERQQTLFGVFWKAFLAFSLIAMLLGCTTELAAVSVPYALAMLVCSVLLLRALRHDPKVYCGRQYQLVNISAVVLVVAAARLISSNAVLNGCVAVLKGAFQWVLQPVLKFLLNVILLVIWGVSKLFSLFSFGGQKDLTQPGSQMDLSGAENLLPDDLHLKEPGQFLRVLGIVLLAAAAAGVLVLFFRWMSRRRGGATVQNTARDEREAIEVSRGVSKRRETSLVRKVRAQYRGFLKWCAGLGVRAERGSTSLDVHRGISAAAGCEETSERIRELYIKARYANEAGQEDAREMKQLCAQVKKPEKPGT